ITAGSRCAGAASRTGTGARPASEASAGPRPRSVSSAGWIPAASGGSVRACTTAELSPLVTKLSSGNTVVRRVSPGYSVWPLDDIRPRHDVIGSLSSDLEPPRLLVLSWGWQHVPLPA